MPADINMADAAVPVASPGARDGDEKCATIEPDIIRQFSTSIYSSLSTLLASDKFSDMTVTCGGREFKAHRAIVCSQSSFFDRALTGGFSESVSGIVDLPEDDPDVLERFLQFLYTGTYHDTAWTGPTDVAKMSLEEIHEELEMSAGLLVPDSCSHTEDGSYQAELSDGEPNEPEEPEEEYYESGEDREFITHAEVESQPTIKSYRQLTNQADDGGPFRVRQNLFLPLRLYIMADKFDVPALKLLARERFYRAAEMSWRDAECFPAVVDELYTNTPDTDLAMREIVCGLVGSCIRDCDQRERMEEVMRKHGDFAVGVMNHMIYSENHKWV